jgi:hypothetical protein
MKKINSLFLAFAFVIAVLAAGSIAANAQETMMKKAGEKVVGTTKKVGSTVADKAEDVGDKAVSTSKSAYKGTRRVGTTVGSKTWNGTKWVASSAYRGGKWVAVKSVNGTKWVYRRGRNAVRGAKRPTP